jgi:hypothetical protein
MVLQPNSGPGLPLWGFVTITFLQGWIVSPAPNTQPGGPGLRIYDPRRQGDPALGTHLAIKIKFIIEYSFLYFDRHVRKTAWRILYTDHELIRAECKRP